MTFWWPFTRDEEGTYTQQIQVLKSETPMDLPPIRELKAVKVPPLVVAAKPKRSRLRKPGLHEVIQLRRNG